MRRLLCWLKRGHLHDGQPMTLVYSTVRPTGHADYEAAVVMQQPCKRCGRPRFTMGVDRAR